MARRPWSYALHCSRGVLLAALFFASLPACSEKDDSRQIRVGGIIASSMIGSAGGRVATADGRTVIEIQPGTFVTATRVTIARVNRAPDLLAGPVVEFGPSGTTLSPPALVTMIIDPADLGAVSVSSTVMAVWNPEMRQWDRLIDQTTQRLSSGLYQRSIALPRFAVVAAAVARSVGASGGCSSEDACRTDAECEVPEAVCDGSERIAQLAWCVACECFRVTEQSDCADIGASCVDGDCVADACSLVACDTPPVPQCEQNVAVSWRSPGTCNDGACDYDRGERDCTLEEATCIDGHCIPHEQCDDGIDNDFDGARDCADSDCDDADVCRDDCPDDSAKMRPGVCGCGVPDIDTDGDGDLDCNDQCQNNPNKSAPGQCGCDAPDIDSDSDGVLDCHDGCPLHASKVTPGICGCAILDTDADGDGTADCLDQCPTDLDKTEPGLCGCGVLDTDTDADGTPNCSDECAVDPAKTEAGACGCGTPDDDGDGDGEPDCSDGCAADPGKTEPGVCGCGIPDVDGDHDGFLVCQDACDDDPDPGKTADPGLCGCGVPDDADGDGNIDCELCADGVDNDDNGLVDCSDAFCHGKTGCELHNLCYNCASDAPLVVRGLLLTRPGAADIELNTLVTYELGSDVPAGTALTVSFELTGGVTFEHIVDRTQLSLISASTATITLVGGGGGFSYADFLLEIDPATDLVTGDHIDLSLVGGIIRTPPSVPLLDEILLLVDLTDDGGAVDGGGEHVKTFIAIAPISEAFDCGNLDANNDPIDDDLDGLANCDDPDCNLDNGVCDQCPGPQDPKVLPGVCGCGVPDDDYDADGLVDCIDDDDDDDGVPDFPLPAMDLCPTGLLGWLSSPSNDYDGDGCHDAVEDLDDDNDQVDDLVDSCPYGVTGWTTRADRDHDGDGCLDADDEDQDDDNDGVLDGADACPTGTLDWSASAATDHDGDGCRDGTTLDPGEDLDDDNDGVLDGADLCPRGDTSWISTAATDHDADGCQDDTEDDDDDNDGIADPPPDLDGDGLPDCPECPDKDNDGQPDCPDLNRDNIPDPPVCPDKCPRGETGWTSSPATDLDADGCRDFGAGFGEDLDDDDDTWSDADELACGSDPLDALSLPVDTDGDGWCDLDVLDTDDDNDGWSDFQEFLCESDPLDPASIPVDHDADLTCDALDDDDDNDTILDVDDSCPTGFIGWIPNLLTNDIDGDGCANDSDFTSAIGPNDEDPDDDNDGWSDIQEVECLTRPDKASSDPRDTPVDTDGDGQCDAIDRDDDNDGIEDPEDICRTVAQSAMEYSDEDSTPDCADGCPNDPLRTEASGGSCICGKDPDCEDCGDSIDNNLDGLPDCADASCAATAPCAASICFRCTDNPPNEGPVRILSEFFSSPAAPRVPLAHELLVELTNDIPAWGKFLVYFNFNSNLTFTQASFADPIPMNAISIRQIQGSTITPIIDSFYGGRRGDQYVYWELRANQDLVAGDKVVVDLIGSGVNVLSEENLQVKLTSQVLDVYFEYCIYSWCYSWYARVAGPDHETLVEILVAEADCANGADDDFNGLADCADDNCVRDADVFDFACAEDDLGCLQEACSNDSQCPLACDQCPDDPYKTEPGLCGCLQPAADPLNETGEEYARRLAFYSDADIDGDGMVSCVDPDDDNDTVLDQDDNCPAGFTGWISGLDSSEDIDIDFDGCMNDADPANTFGDFDEDSDDDGDGWSDDEEVVCGSDPLNKSVQPLNTDAFLPDGSCPPGIVCDDICDALDIDDDGDGWTDRDEVLCGSAPLDSDSTPTDTDGDWLCDVCFGPAGECVGIEDFDDDNDGLLDVDDPCPLEVLPHADTDADFVPDCIDLCPTDPTTAAPGVCGCGVPPDDPDCALEQDCSDGRDNNDDGLWDCGDPECFENATDCPDPFLVCYNCQSSNLPEVLSTVLSRKDFIIIPMRSTIRYELTTAAPAGSELNLQIVPSLGVTFEYDLAPSDLTIESGASPSYTATLTSGGARGNNHVDFRIQLDPASALAAGDALVLDFGPTAGVVPAVPPPGFIPGTLLNVPSAFAYFRSVRLRATLTDSIGEVIDPAAEDLKDLLLIRQACIDTIDNDGDGDIDCDDSECLTSPHCAPTEVCTDDFDNDDDGLADCNDAGDCVTACPAGLCEITTVLFSDVGFPVATGNTVDAPNMTNITPPPCGGNYDLASDHLVAWIAPAAGRYEIDTRGSNYDTLLYVLNGDCYGPVITCNDDWFESLDSRVEIDVVKDQAVTIVVTGYYDRAGYYELNITPLPE